MSKYLRIIISIAVIALIAAPAYAAKGVVVYNKSCDYYAVETNRGYALLEWFGGNDPSEGDVMVGDYETYGMKEIYNVTADTEAKVWVEDFWLSKDSLIEKIREHCN